MLKLPKLISEGCILQHGDHTKIYGWCNPGLQVAARILNQEQTSQADEDGRWEILFSHLPYGGPYPMEITAGADESVLLTEVYIGEVWLTSGQSNMELPINRVKDQYPQELFISQTPLIRIFTASEQYEFCHPLEDYEEGKWKACDETTIQDFSAFSYFFASYLLEDRKVPIGIINSSLGGSRIEAWMSRDALKDYPEHIKTADMYLDRNYLKQQALEMENSQIIWQERLDEKEKESNHIEPWRDIVLPGFFKDQGLEELNGVLYLRKKLMIPASMAEKPAKLWLGTLVDSDKTYVNGHLVGETGYQYPPRKYLIPEGILKTGENEILIRLVCKDGRGRVTPGKEMRLFYEKEIIDLSGTWQVRIGCRCQPAPAQDFIRRKPTSLYHAMLAPCQSFGIRGVVWYQGESNDRMAGQYEGLLKQLIMSWREQWGQEHLPFIIIQLPNFSIDLPDQGSGWPEIREAQSQAGNLEDVAVTVNLDLGEDNDLHPLRKRETAYRAALAARGMVYGEPIVWKSPVMQSWNTEEGTINKEHKAVSVYFDTGDNGGLVTKNGEEPDGFLLAGEDGIFHPATGKIAGGQVILYSDSVKNPTEIRYAWCNAPGTGLLYNQSGLPAQPFRTDNRQEVRDDGKNNMEGK